MAVRLSAGRYHSFVVRIWSGDGAETTMRGQITHIASRQSVGFTDLQRALSFIAKHLAEGQGAPPGGAGEAAGADGSLAASEPGAPLAKVGPSRKRGKP